VKKSVPSVCPEFQRQKKTGAVFQIPNDFDFKKLSGSHFGVHWSDDEIKVNIRFNVRVADYVRERTWHPSQKIVECETGDVVLSLTVNHLLELKRWLLSWGEDAQVLEPDYFADDILQAVNKTSELYK
jgi:predicted DNA-binding transcriptional regulator YafY